MLHKNHAGKGLVTCDIIHFIIIDRMPDYIQQFISRIYQQYIIGQMKFSEELQEQIQR